MNLSVVIPVYGSEKILPDLVARLESALPTMAEAYEVIFVCDDSPDDAWRVICEAREKHPWIRGYRLMRNFGQHSALICGIRHATYEVVCTMDDDLQHAPEAIPRLLEKLTPGVDVVYAPPLREKHGVFRDMASQVTKMVLKSAMGAETARHVSAFRVFRRDLRNAFSQFQGPQPNLDVLLTWGTRRFAVQPVEHHERAQGESNYTFRALVRHAMNMMTGFSTIPLQVASLLGFVCTGFGVLMLVWVLGRYVVQGSPVPGFPFLASAIAIFSGAQLFSLGIIGEYLARMHFRIMDRPTYVESDGQND